MFKTFIVIFISSRMNASEIVELLDKTYTQDNKFKFVADTHVYTYGTDVYTSVTTFLQRFHKPFKMDYWAEIKAAERGITKDEILNEWKETNLKSTIIGSALHEHIEYYFKGIYTPLTNNMDLIRRINKFNIIFAQKLYKLTPVVFEQKIFSKRLRIAGTIDSIFIYEGKIYIIDWKSNKSLKTDDHPKGKYEKLLKPFNKFYKNELNEYSIQLSLYALILSEIGIKVDDMFLVHIPDEGDAKIYKTVDMRDILNSYFDDAYFNSLNDVKQEIN